jgi:hypothetical protein
MALSPYCQQHFGALPPEFFPDFGPQLMSLEFFPKQHPVSARKFNLINGAAL